MKLPNQLFCLPCSCEKVLKIKLRDFKSDQKYFTR